MLQMAGELRFISRDPGLQMCPCSWKKERGNWDDCSLNIKRRDKDLHCVTYNWGELFIGKKCPFLQLVVSEG